MAQQQIANIGWVQVPVPMEYGILRCEICRQDIGRFKPENLSAPLKADMFEPITKGYPHPFRIVPGMPLSLEWEHTSCPYCRNRPFLDKDAVMTPRGKYKVGTALLPGIQIPIELEVEPGPVEVDPWDALAENTVDLDELLAEMGYVEEEGVTEDDEAGTRRALLKQRIKESPNKRRK